MQQVRRTGCEAGCVIRAGLGGGCVVSSVGRSAAWSGHGILLQEGSGKGGMGSSLACGAIRPASLRGGELVVAGMGGGHAPHTPGEEVGC